MYVCLHQIEGLHTYTNHDVCLHQIEGLHTSRFHYLYLIQFYSLFKLCVPQVRGQHPFIIIHFVSLRSEVNTPIHILFGVPQVRGQHPTHYLIRCPSGQRSTPIHSNSYRVPQVRGQHILPFILCPSYQRSAYSSLSIIRHLKSEANAFNHTTIFITSHQRPKHTFIFSHQQLYHM